MRKIKTKSKFEFGSLISLRSCVPESLQTQIESHYNEQASLWVDNETLAIFLSQDDHRVTVMCNGYVGWVWYDECKAVNS